MKSVHCFFLAGALLALAFPRSALAEQANSSRSETSSSAPAAGIEMFASTDSDKTDVLKILGRALWKFDGQDNFQGIDIERAWYRPQGQYTREQTRVYLEAADGLSSNWRWRARVGTNGHTIIGSASLRSSDWSKEFFLEREVVETPKGVDQGIYYTLGGASMDFAASENDRFNAMAGLQQFTGRNLRVHLRANYVHVTGARSGLSVQLRARYFHSTVPAEFDYYSPRDFFQIIPVVQLRRFDRSGWMYLIALGYGAQKATGSGWQGAKLADLRIESPVHSRKMQAFVQLQYSNNSLNQGGGNYHYVSARAGLTARLR